MAQARDTVSRKELFGLWIAMPRIHDMLAEGPAAARVVTRCTSTDRHASDCRASKGRRANGQTTDGDEDSK